MPSGSNGYSVLVKAGYDLAGNMTDLTYPDGRHIQQTFDSPGRILTSNLVDINGTAASQSYLESVVYNPDSSPNTLTLGNGVVQTFTQNNRLQPQQLTVSSPLAPFNGAAFLNHTYCYSNCSTGGSANTGSIWGITDNLSSARTQGFTYDSLNRISSFSLGGALNQQYSIDHFGNLSGMSGGSPTQTFNVSNTNRIDNLPCAATVNPSYDSSGNQLCDTDPFGNVREYVYDAENRITAITSPANGGSTVESYIYGAGGDRVRKTQTASGSYTDYVRFGGAVLAESSNGSWTDYIYGGGREIARVAQQVPFLHLRGSNNQAGVECGVNITAGMSYVVKNGDRISWAEYKNNASGGMMHWFDNNSLGDQWSATDTNGVYVNDSNQENVWLHRTADLSSYAGHTMDQIAILKDYSTPAGAWDIWISDLAIYSTDGTVTTIAGSAGGGSLSGASCQGPADYISAEMQAAGTAPGIQGSGTDTHFYVGDHLGTAQLELSSGGWPLWQGQFAPFGQEIDTESTANNYKYTGLEHDPESGQEHAQFRQLASVQGRWMSADPYDGSMNLSNPQTLNRYGYVSNMPLNFSDPTGLLDPPCHGDPTGCSTGGGGSFNGGGFFGFISDAAQAIESIFSFFHHPKLTASHTPRPPVRQVRSTITQTDTHSFTMITQMQNPWEDADGIHGFAASVIQGEGSGVFVAADKAVTYGVYGYGATYALALAVPTVVGSLPTAQVAFGTHPIFTSPHFAVGMDGVWMNGLVQEGSLTMTTDYAGWFAGQASTYIFNVPVLFPEAVLPEEGSAAINCFTGACSAIVRGWIP